MIHIKISDSYELMSKRAADFIVSRVNMKPEALLCFPAGDTPRGVFRQLVRYAACGVVDFSRCRFVGLDEWVGMGREDEGSCQHFLYRELFGPLHIEDSRICFFNARAVDLQVECRRVDRYLAESGPIDLVLLGVGLNGHVGFNEPGADMRLGAHVTVLEPVTAAVGQKYFVRQTTLDRGITLGLQHILAAKTAVLIADGPAKAAIIKKTAEDRPTTSVPASMLQRHGSCVLYLDREAASALGKTEARSDQV